MAFRRETFNETVGFWEFPPFGADDLDSTVKVLDKGGRQEGLRRIVGIYSEEPSWEHKVTYGGG